MPLKSGLEHLSDQWNCVSSHRLIWLILADHLLLTNAATGILPLRLSDYHPQLPLSSIIDYNPFLHTNLPKQKILFSCISQRSGEKENPVKYVDTKKTKLTLKNSCFSSYRPFWCLLGSVRWTLWPCMNISDRIWLRVLREYGTGSI